MPIGRAAPRRWVRYRKHMRGISLWNSAYRPMAALVSTGRSRARVFEFVNPVSKDFPWPDVRFRVDAVVPILSYELSTSSCSRWASWYLRSQHFRRTNNLLIDWPLVSHDDDLVEQLYNLLIESRKKWDLLWAREGTHTPVLHCYSSI